MKILVAAASAAAMAAFVPAIAQAQDAAPTTGAYANLGYGYLDGQGSHLDAALARFGYRFMPFVGVEGEGAIGIGSASDSSVPGGSVKLKNELAAYAVGFAPLSDRLDLLARVGYGTQKFRAKGGGVTVSDRVESFNYGIGAQYHLDGVNGFRADWTRYDFKEGYGHGDVYAITYSRKF